jgi:streptogramin lyase
VANSDSDNVVMLDNNNGNIVAMVPVGESPQDIAIDPSGNVWVANFIGNSVSKISSYGSLIGTYKVGEGPGGIAADGEGNVSVTNEYDDNIMKLDSNGNILNTITVGSDGTNPIGIAIDGRGNIWIVNSGLNILSEITISTLAPTTSSPTITRSPTRRPKMHKKHG